MVAELVVEDDEAYSGEEARRRLGNIGRTTFHEMVRRGDLRVVRIGAKVLVPRSEVVRLLALVTNDAHDR